MSDACNRLGIFGREACQRVEAEGCIPHTPGERADDVAQAAQRHHADVGNQPEARLDADQCLGGGGVLDRAAGLLRKAQHRHAGRDGRRAPGAAATGQELAVDGVVGRSGPAVVGVASGVTEDRDVGLAEDDGVGGAHACHNRCVGGRHQVDAARLAGQRRAAARGGEAPHVHRVLDHHRHAGKRAERLSHGTATVDGTRGRQRFRIEEDDRIVVRVVRCDPGKAGLRQLFAGQGAAGEAGLDAFDREVGEVELRRNQLWPIVHDISSDAASNAVPTSTSRAKRTIGADTPLALPPIGATRSR